MSTVNGRTLREVLNDLRAYKEPPHKTNDGYGYFKGEEFIGAFDDIVGVANYNVTYTDHAYRQISTGQELFSVKCTITIIDDDGRPLLSRESYGGYVCKYAHQSGNDVNLQNSPDFVCTYAFKNAAKRFGIFGLKTKDIGDDPVADTSKKITQKDSSADKKSTVVNFYTKGSFEEIRREKVGNEERPVYKITAYEMINPQQCKNTVSQIIFYPNQYSKDESTSKIFNHWIVACNEKQIKMKIKTKAVGTDNDGIPQYVFLGCASA